jgi:predicted DNA-binding protein (MmcQ/YjbR family)
MNIEAIRDYCLLKKGVSESFPFGEKTLVFKLMGKVFLLTNLEETLSINLKCDPERAIELREKYSFIYPAYHMNKKHWNTVIINNFLNDSFIYSLIDHSYELVKKNLSKDLQKELN